MCSLHPSAVYGSAIHSVLQRAHSHLSATGERRPVEDILHDFEQLLEQSRLASDQREHLLQRGSDTLTAYFAAQYDSFRPDQVVEKNFAAQGAVIGAAKLTGAIDLLEIDNTTHQVIVTDYKTGKGTASWLGRTEFEKIKLHKYRQQLMFYKLLVEHSRDYAGHYTVDEGVLAFVEANRTQGPSELHLSFEPEELARFARLIEAVWQRIMSLDLPDISGYDATYKGILAFEADLIS